MTRRFLLILALAATGCGTAATPAPRPAAAGKARSEWLFRQGLDAASRGDSIRAEQYIALARAGGYPEERALPALLKVCLASSRLRAALDYADPYLRRHPDHDPLRFLVASIHAGLGQRDDALTELERLTRHNPRFEEAHFLRAVLVEERAPDEAIGSLRSYLDLAPRGEHAAEARSRLSDLLVHRGDREETP